MATTISLLVIDALYLSPALHDLVPGIGKFHSQWTRYSGFLQRQREQIEIYNIQFIKKTI